VSLPVVNVRDIPIFCKN